MRWYPLIATNYYHQATSSEQRTVTCTYYCYYSVCLKTFSQLHRLYKVESVVILID
jgi:hypothetical protein